MRTSGWRFAKCVSLSLIVMLPLSALVFGQESTGNIYGRVVDEQGSGIPGATATLTGETAPRSTTSDANGYFRFLYIAPGRYAVTVTMPGFASLERENVIVALGKNTDVEMPLKVSGVEETVRVISATPLIDTRKVQTGITFSNVELQDIPTSRDIYSLMQQVPGVQLDQVNVAGAASGRVGGPDFTTKGSGGVTYLIDGATVTDNSYGSFNAGQARQNGGNATFFDFESFDEVDVATGGSLVDLQTPGVTINIVTKRGTNELKGSARFFYASDDWQSNNLTDEAIEQGFETNSTRFVREYGAEVGGPILKDRLWIWGSGARQDISLNLTGEDAEGNRIRTTARIVPFTAKLSAQLAASNSMSLFYQRGDRFEGNTGKSSSRGFDTLRDLTIESDFYKLEDDHVFSPDLIASVYLSHQRPTYDAHTRIGHRRTNRLLRRHLPRKLADLYDPEPSVPGQRHVVQVLQHRLGQPRAEVRIQLPPPGQRLRVGVAGRPDLRIRVLDVRPGGRHARRPGDLQGQLLHGHARATR